MSTSSYFQQLSLSDKFIRFHGTLAVRVLEVISPAVPRWIDTKLGKITKVTIRRSDFVKLPNNVQDFLRQYKASLQELTPNPPAVEDPFAKPKRKRSKKEIAEILQSLQNEAAAP